MWVGGPRGMRGRRGGGGRLHGVHGRFVVLLPRCVFAREAERDAMCVRIRVRPYVCSAVCLPHIQVTTEIFWESCVALVPGAGRWTERILLVLTRIYTQHNIQCISIK